MILQGIGICLIWAIRVSFFGDEILDPYTMKIGKGIGNKSKSILSKSKKLGNGGDFFIAKFVKSILGQSDDAINTIYTPQAQNERVIMKKRVFFGINI